MTQPANPSNWLSPFTANPQARLRLFCLPFAGDGASLFRQWQTLLGPQFEIIRVQLPGRENRLPEPAYTDLSELVRVLSGRGPGVLYTQDKTLYSAAAHSGRALFSLKEVEAPVPSKQMGFGFPQGGRQAARSEGNLARIRCDNQESKRERSGG